MYIKQIIIQGFKSYKEQTVFEPFSPKTNVIVGRNGSGKSNFFAAIRFVLSDAYTQMGREERQALLHEGSGSAVMSAYVEIIFDNSDDRFPTGKPELILRRTIGLKKDEYSLDRKSATKTDVMNLLESAGFSRSNPYYIVPQGRVTTLTNMKDPERLNLLKEVAGTQVYEARRTESLKIMTETNNKRGKIDELLDYIKDRLSELEEEKEELRGYQEKDKDRRCLEYAFFAKEQEAMTAMIENLEHTRNEGLDSTDEKRQQFQSGEKAIQELEKEIKQLGRRVDLLKLERKQLEEDRLDTTKKSAKLELDVKGLTHGLSATEQARAQQQQELKSVKAELASKQKELTKLLPEYEKRRAKESEIKHNLDTAQGTVTQLYNKQGRSAQFKSKAERDKHLKKEIDDVSTKLGEQKANRIHADEEVKGVHTEIKTLESEIAGLRTRFEGWGGNRKLLQDEVSTARDALTKLKDERKLLRREEDKLVDMIKEASSERSRAENELSHTMDNATSRGLASIRRLKQEQNIQGAYGTLAELFDVDETYRTAAEQTAGNSLFHYVVDNDVTAEKLMVHLSKNSAGRITFMPLSRLSPRHIKLPKAMDAQGLQTKLRYDKKYEAAISQVFGTTIVCPSLAVATQYARSHGCDAITPDGDKSNKKGAMTGGYVDTRKSRLEAVRTVNKWCDEVDTLKSRLEEIRKEINSKDQAVTHFQGEDHKKERKLHDFEDSFDSLKTELNSKNRLLEVQRARLDEEDRSKEKVGRLQAQYASLLDSLEKEIASDFKKSLSAIEESQLEQLSITVQELQKEWNEISNERRELESRKQTLEIEIRDTLQLRLDQLNSQEIDSAASGGSAELKQAQKNLARFQKAAKETISKLQEIENQVEGGEQTIFGLEKEKATQIENQDKFAREIERQQKSMEKSIAKKAIFTASATETARNIRDLGVLPEEAFEKYVNHDTKSIQKKLAKVTEALKKYKHVNKKAFEQYNSFTTQRDSLTKRRKELDDSQSSIQDLVEVLDQRKDEAIERTFKQVSKEFAQIFERLVPAGRGRLVIQRKTDQRNREDDSDDEPRESVENYTGVGISVSFNSKHDEQQRIQQLSGGQKSLCALALVFAIQQCDPAPFYLFDEIDANLDAQYRTAVAQMLEDISTQQSQAAAGGSKDKDAPPAMSGQFICTTFRPEMLLVADKCYGVTFHNKTSGIEVVSREEALRFVDGEAPK